MQTANSFSKIYHQYGNRFIKKSSEKKKILSFDLFLFKLSYKFHLH